jgi:hypothetical protein
MAKRGKQRLLGLTSSDAPPEQSPQPEPPDLPLVKVVGLSGSGKSTLVQGLRRAGYRARPVSQEHSSVQDLWAHFGRPEILIYLSVDVPAQIRRRPAVPWSLPALREEEQRLDHARENADLRINTSELGPAEVLAIALRFLRDREIRHWDRPLGPLPITGGSAREA